MKNYQKIKKIGKGNFGDVLLVERIYDKKQYALKIVELPGESTTIDSSYEAKLLETLDHPNIIKCHESFIEKTNLCIILEYADNGDLLKKIQEARQAGAYLPESLILEWFAQLCLALKYLHDRKILHRDIKVQNTFLTKNGIIKLGDFGISKQLTSTLDFAKSQVGTPFYLSPEMCLSSTHTHKSDIWMLGCLLHELCSLSKPFPGDAIHVLVNKIAKEKFVPIPDHFSSFIKDLISKLLEKNPDDRPNINQILEIPEISNEVANIRLRHEKLYQYVLSSKEIDSALLPKPHLAHRSLFEEEKKGSPSKKSSSFEQFKNVQSLKIDLISKIDDQQHDQRNPKSGEQDKDKIAKNQELGTVQNMTSPRDNAKPPLPESNSVKRRKISQNSITYVLQQKAKLNLSPSSIERTGTPISNSILIQHSFGEKDTFSAYAQLDSNVNSSQPSPLIKPSKIIMESDEEHPSFEVSQSNSNIIIKEENTPQAFSSFLQNTSKNIEPIKKPYHRDISINTAVLEPMYANNSGSKDDKEKNNTFKSPNNDMNQSQLETPNSIPTTKVQNKSFTFSERVFDHKSPTSPGRSFWFCQFLRNKLGEEKFEKIKQVLEASPNPMQVIEEQKAMLIEIMGEENHDYIKMLKCLISSSVTPTSDTKASSKNNSNSSEIFKSFSFDKIIKSPLSANFLGTANNLSFVNLDTINNNNTSNNGQDEIKSSGNRKTPERPMRSTDRSLSTKENLKSPNVNQVRTPDGELLRMSESYRYIPSQNSKRNNNN